MEKKFIYREIETKADFVTLNRAPDFAQSVTCGKTNKYVKQCFKSYYNVVDKISLHGLDMRGNYFSFLKVRIHWKRTKNARIL